MQILTTVLRLCVPLLLGIALYVSARKPQPQERVVIISLDGMPEYHLKIRSGQCRTARELAAKAYTKSTCRRLIEIEKEQNEEKRLPGPRCSTPFDFAHYSG